MYATVDTHFMAGHVELDTCSHKTMLVQDSLSVIYFGMTIPRVASFRFKNAGRSILKSSNLWRFTILMTSAHNCVYGSLLSPGRIFQIVEAVADYMSHAITCPAVRVHAR